jgi:hypothetical protein
VCRFSSSFQWRRWWLSVGTPGFWELDSVIEPVAGVALPKDVLTSRARWMLLIVVWNACTNMFYVLKHLLLPYLVILKQSCNNILYCNFSFICFVYVFARSCFIENSPIWILEDGPLISEVDLSQAAHRKRDHWEEGYNSKSTFILQCSFSHVATYVHCVQVLGWARGGVA